MQGPHQRDDHDPSGLIRALAVLTAALVAAPGAGAARPRYAALPSPLAPLSATPPLSGGAASSSEGLRHRVTAVTSVRVSLAASGTPFAVMATQKLDVRVQGDYFFTIGAPVLDVEAAAGSASSPGLRSSSIIWAGFNPGHRVLAARLTLAPRAVARVLPMRIEVHGGQTTLVNTTGITVDAYTADATTRPLLSYLARLRGDLRAGRAPTSGAAYLTSAPQTARVRVVAPLVVTGRIGSHEVARTLTGRLVVPATGPIHLSVSPRLSVGDPGALARNGRQLLELAVSKSLEAARLRQYQAFLGNPDPAGSNRTTYEYVSAKRPVPVVALAPVEHGRDWARSLLLAGALAGAAALGLLAWARS